RHPIVAIGLSTAPGWLSALNDCCGTERLRKLTLQASEADSESLGKLGSSSQLSGLKVIHVVAADDGEDNPDCDRLLMAPSTWTLESLTLEVCKVHPDTLEGFLNSTACQSLRRLEISGCDLSPLAAELIAGAGALSNLRELNLDVNQLSSTGARILAQSRHLARLAVLSL